MKEKQKDTTALIDEVLEKIPNKYLAVTVSSKRARAINDGIRPLVKAGTSKPTTIAMEEISAGVVVPGPARPELKEAPIEEEGLLPSPDSDDSIAEEPEDLTEKETEEE